MKTDQIQTSSCCIEFQALKWKQAKFGEATKLRSIHLPYALGGTFNSPAHGDAATTEATDLPDELIGLLQGSLAGER